MANHEKWIENIFQSFFRIHQLWITERVSIFDFNYEQKRRGNIVCDKR